MRTTMNLNDDLYRQAKALAAVRGCSVASFIEDALRTALMEFEQPSAFRALPVSRQGGDVMPGIDLHDSRSLHAVLDEGIPIDALR